MPQPDGLGFSLRSEPRLATTLPQFRPAYAGSLSTMSGGGIPADEFPPLIRFLGAARRHDLPLKASNIERSSFILTKTPTRRIASASNGSGAQGRFDGLSQAELLKIVVQKDAPTGLFLQIGALI